MHLLAPLVAVLMTVSVQAFEKEKIYAGATGEEVPLETVLDRVTAGSVVIVSELHGFAPHHEHQLKVIEGLQRRGHQVSVGFEFVDYLHQSQLDQYLTGAISEKQFLLAVEWGGTPFRFYKRQMRAPLNGQGWSFGVNAPRLLSSKIARMGLSSLSNDEQALLPPNFTVGNDIYRARFKEIMGGHVDPTKLENYFAAQSLWDDTSAWKIIENMVKNPSQVMVIIFGDFHNAYGGGLPDRLRARGLQQVVSISQVDIANLSVSEQEEIILAHDKYGVRADYIWTADSNDHPMSHLLVMPSPWSPDKIGDFQENGSVLTINGIY